MTAGSSATDPLRVALVCPYSLSRPGGVQGQVIGLARVLAGRGHRVTVFAPLDRPQDAPDGIDLVATGRATALPANGSVAPVSLSVPAVARARHALVAGGFDVVHVHEPLAPGLPWGLLVGGRIPPLVATFHRSGGSALYTVLAPLIRRATARFAVLCAVSEAARATVERALGAPCQVGFNGVEVDRYRDAEPWPSDRPAVLFLGRHEERKGLEVLLEAFSRLAGRPISEATLGRAGPPLLWIAGDGPQTGDLRRRFPGSSDIEWLGVLSESEKERRLAAADVLCAPSLGGESFGMVLLEAMASATVVVASDIDGYRDAAGGHAVLVPPADAGALTSALAGVLAGESAVIGGGDAADPDPQLGRRRWLAGASDRASAWSMDALADWYEGHYRAAVVGPRG
jgi:phosphatidyl-myo-inositol alpha-mannosyltransferase